MGNSSARTAQFGGSTSSGQACILLGALSNIIAICYSFRLNSRLAIYQNYAQCSSQMKVMIMESNQMPIDAVITWVNGDDPAHMAKRRAYLDNGVHIDSSDSTRFACRNEIRYCVWSILHFCPFVRRLYIVTDDQYPNCIAPILELHPDWEDRIALIDHQTIFGDHKSVLPVFNSRSIETMLHRIPGLSEHFIYLNDDIFVGRSLTSDYFFDRGKPILRGSLVRHPSFFLSAIKQFFRRRRPSRASFKEAQRRAAVLLGFNKNFLYSEHYPHPMRRSTMSRYFSDREHSLRSQIGHRFRSAEQYSPIGLANHLELLEGAAIRPPGPKGYIKPPHSKRVQKRNYKALEGLKGGEFDTICIQSLDKMSSTDQGYIVSSLDAWVAASEAKSLNVSIPSNVVTSHLTQPARSRN